MKKTKLFILDYDKQFLNDLEVSLKEEETLEVIKTSNDSYEALNYLKNGEELDVLVINLLMANIDGISFLRKIHDLNLTNIKKIIVTSFFANSDIMNVLQELDVVYFLMYPYTKENLIEVINILLPNSQKRENEMLRKIDSEIVKLFIDIGIPANLKGYNYLKQAIIECVYNHHQIDYMTKELYPLIGEKYSCSAMSVERSMRTAIRVAVERGNEKTLDALFGHSISIYKDNPTNSEFISIIAEKLRLKLLKIQSVA